MTMPTPASDLSEALELPKPIAAVSFGALTILDPQAVIQLARAERARQEAAALTSIKAMYASGGHPATVDQVRSAGRAALCLGPRYTRKLKPSGAFLGWYRPGQRNGRPSSVHPVDQEQHLWEAAVRAAVPQPIAAKFQGYRSGVSRRANRLDAHIAEAWHKHELAGTPTHKRSKLIAKALNCSFEYVRRLVRKLRLRRSKT